MLLAVADEEFTSAAEELHIAHDGLARAARALTARLLDGAGMARDDAGGREIASSHDPAAGELLRTGCELETALGVVATLLDATAANHRDAEAASVLPNHARGIE